MEWMIRHATPADLDSVLTLVEALETEDPSPEPFQREATGRALAHVVDDPSLGRLYVATAGADVVGYLLLAFGFSLEYLGRDAFIDSFYVAPDFRGQGVGSAMLARVESDALEFGIKALHLEVSPELPAARLYHRMGFVPHKRTLMTRWISLCQPSQQVPS